MTWTTFSHKHHIFFSSCQAKHRYRLHTTSQIHFATGINKPPLFPSKPLLTSQLHLASETKLVDMKRLQSIRAGASLNVFCYAFSCCNPDEDNMTACLVIHALSFYGRLKIFVFAPSESRVRYSYSVNNHITLAQMYRITVTSE